MKTLIKQILLTTIVSLSLFNCSKDDDMDDVTPHAENKRLIAYSLNASEYTVTYDSNGRPTNFSNDPSNPGTVIYNSDNQIIQMWLYSYTYNTQGRISKITQPDNSTFKDAETTLTYNNEGLVAYQTSNFTYVSSGNTTYFHRTYSYNDSNQLISVTENSTNYGYTRELLNYDSYGNIVQIKNQRSADGTNYIDDVTFNYTYDNKQNPIKKLLHSAGISSNLSLLFMNNLNTFEFGNFAFFRTHYYSNNNPTSRQILYSSGSSNRTFTYVYNDEGYPTSVEIHTVNSDGTDSTSYRTWTYETY